MGGHSGRFGYNHRDYNQSGRWMQFAFQLMQAQARPE